MNHFKQLESKIIFNTLAFICMPVLLPSLAISLESDRDQQIEIESDSAELREVEGLTLTVYSGNVRMSQGSILLLADTMTIYIEDGDVSRLVATGDRAYYEQIPAEGQEKITAQGKTIEYILADDVINLIEQASLAQEGATLNANRITYDVRNSLLIGNKSTSTVGGNQGPKERVKVVIPSLGPRKSQDK